MTNVNKNYVIVRPEKGGGSRNVVLPNDATYNDVLNKCEEMVLPDGTSYFSDIVHFSVILMSFNQTYRQYERWPIHLLNLKAFDENINLPEVSINTISNDSGLIGRSSERLALNENY